MEFNNSFLEKFQKEAYETAVSKGWHESDELDANGHPTARQKLAWLALVTDELDEAVIERANGRFDTYYDLKGKPCGFHTEYADALIRIGDMCGACGWKLSDRSGGHSGRAVSLKRNVFTEAIRCGDQKTQSEVVSQLFWTIVFEWRLSQIYPTECALLSALDVKMAYNKTRSHRHGGKLA